MTDLSTAKLAELVSKRRKCLVQLRDVGRTQFEMASAGQTNELLRLLAAKEQLLAALQAIDKQMAPFHDQDPQSRFWASPEDRTRCALDVEACQQLMREVVELEQAAERQATILRDDAAGQLRSAASAGRVRDAYLQNDRRPVRG